MNLFVYFYTHIDLSVKVIFTPIRELSIVESLCTARANAMTSYF